MMRRRRGAALFGTGLAGALAVSAAAWACTPQARIVALSAESAPAGSEVSIRGEGVPPLAPVAVHWDDLRGPVLASVTADANGTFSTVLTVPAAAPGVHSVVAAAGGERVVGIARTAFEVTPGPGEATPKSPDLTLDRRWDEGRAAARERSSGPAAPLVAGVALLGAGLASLASGFAVALGRRRRAVAARQAR